MKGIFMYHLDRKEEAIETIKSGIKQNLKSSLCWNILGLVYRCEKNLVEAAKCYKTAAKFDPQNVQILRDLATIQTHIANYTGLVETRLSLVKLVPTNRTFWIALSVAYKLNNEVQKAIDVIDQFESSIQEERNHYDNSFLANELSRISEFKLQLMIETCQWSNALDYLERIELDAERQLKFKALLHLRNNEISQAHELYECLLSKFNCNCAEYVDGWIESLPSDLELVDALESLSGNLPNSLLLKTRYFVISPFTDSFKQVFELFINFYLEKGKAACYSLLKSILFCEKCIDPSEKKEFLLNYLRNIPSSYTSLLIQANLHRKLENYEQAHLLLNLLEPFCTDNNQKLTEFHFARSKVYKNQKNTHSAVESIQKVHELNPKDRYFNSKTIKYLLLNNNIEQAFQLMTLFFKDEKVENMKEFFDMQPIWFCEALISAYHRTGNSEKALEYSCRILEYFEEMLHDPYDFHSYCLRKMTICQYLDMLEVTKHLIESTKYINAIQIASLSYQPGDILLDKMQQLSINDSKLLLLQRSINRLPKTQQTSEMLLVLGHAH